MPDRRKNLLIARETVTAMLALRRLWTATTGHASGAEVGVILTEVYFTSNPWVTAQYVTGRLAGAYSDDTIRRRLEELVDRSSVEVVEAGGRKLYRACSGSALATVAILKEACGAIGH